MSENNNGTGKKSALIRSVICLAVIAIIALGMFKIIPTTISLITACAMLVFIAIWNGAALFKGGKKQMAVFNFIIAVIVAVISVGFIMTELGN